jgi:hypothetical protein
MLVSRLYIIPTRFKLNFDIVFFFLSFLKSKTKCKLNILKTDKIVYQLQFKKKYNKKIHLKNLNLLLLYRSTLFKIIKNKNVPFTRFYKIEKHQY